jgi:hypothetical protein
MFGKKRTGMRLLVILIVPLLIILSGCAAKKKVLVSETSDLVLKYSMPENRILKYRLTSNLTQNMEIRGQSVGITSDDTRLFSVQSTGWKEGNFQLGVTIDSMNIKVVTPQGEIIPDLSSVMGQSFSMALSPLGKETDLPDVKTIQYELVSGEKESVVTLFQALFPDLPQGPIMIGDTWLAYDTIIDKSNKGELSIILESKNRLDGFEKVEGLECAKITAEVTGIMAGKGQEGGVDLISTADIAGDDTWYFAINEGVFVMMESNGIGEGTINASGPEKMTIPIKREYQIEAKLLK